ncbi:MAG: hypothetical protein JW729_10250 [Bacteroidales bacterium]|nr:hypothetical protein [Bacteroidales bacterium]
MRFYLISIICFFFIIDLHAQGEMIGANASNTAGVNSLFLNPSAMHNQKVWLSINFFSGNLFLHTDFAYFDKNEFKYTDLLNSTIQLIEHPTGYGTELRSFYSYNSEKNTTFDENIRILGPSAMLMFNQHAFAISTSVRVQSNVVNLTPDLANILAYGFSYFPQYNYDYKVDHFSSSTMAWSEIGFSYAYRLNNESWNSWSFGISVKKLFGAGGAYLKVDNSTYTLIDSKTIDVENQQAQMGFALPIDYTTNEFINQNMLNGRGWAFDLGFTFQYLNKHQPKLNSKRLCEQAIIPYKFRLSFALLDIGSIKYFENAQTHDFSNSVKVRGDMNGVNLDNVNQVIQLMSDQFYGSSTASLLDNSMKLALPMAASAQFDYNLEQLNLYFNASVIYGIPQKIAALHRPSQISFTPRYETRLIEFSLPMSLYRFKYPHIGIYLRYGIFGVGSDWLTSLISNQDFYGMDFYFTTKLQLFKGKCRARGSFNKACGDKSGRLQWGN